MAHLVDWRWDEQRGDIIRLVFLTVSFLARDTCTAEVAIRPELRVSKMSKRWSLINCFSRSSNRKRALSSCRSLGIKMREENVRFIRFIFDFVVAITCLLVSKLPNFTSPWVDRACSFSVSSPTFADRMRKVYMET